MERDFTSQSDGLVPTTKYRFATCFGMAQQPSADGNLGIPRNSYQVPWFGCQNKAVLNCFVKSFPNVEPSGNQQKGKEKTKDSTAQPTANLNPKNMYLEADCTSIGIERWNELMKGARKASYPRLVRRIKKELPKLYATLSLDAYNPWCGQCQQTRTHYILVHSAIEYFIRK